MLSPEALALRASRRPWRVVGGWAVLLAVAAAAAFQWLGGALNTEAEVSQRTEAKRATDLLLARMPEAVTPDWEYVVVRSRSLTVAEPPFAVAVAEVRRELAAAGYRPVELDRPIVSPDLHALLVAFDPAGRGVASAVEIGERLDASPAFDAAAYGPRTVSRDFHAISGRDLRTAETFGIAAALVVLVAVFGSLLAALVPLALALIAAVPALAAVALIGQVYQLSVFVTNMVAGMGLALGIDYSLFVLSRYREERARGRSTEEAIVGAGATASRAVLFSGTAVAVALASMALVPDTVLRSLATGAVLVAVVAVAAALTLLPALLGLLGDRINAGRVPLLGGGAAAEGRVWGAVARAVMRRPVVSLVASAGILLAAASPLTDLRTGAAGVSTLPPGEPSRRGFELLQESFGAGGLRPAEVVVSGDVAAARPALARLTAAVRADPAFGEPDVAAKRDVALLRARVAGDPTGDRAIAAVERLRERYVPRARFPAGTEVVVGGQTAANVDYVSASNASRPRVLAFVLALSFLLLTVAFRSVVVPLKAILLNLLSVGAAYGLLVLVFEKGYGAGLLGVGRSERIEVWVPLLLFAILFGLSMDYHVFLLSRIRERYRLSGDNTSAVEFGIATTARIITGAALIIIVVFTGFILGELVMFQQMGFGVAVALLLDATLVRVVLVPAAMKLLGSLNWYLPRWLRWLPELTVERAPDR